MPWNVVGVVYGTPSMMAVAPGGELVTQAAHLGVVLGGHADLEARVEHHLHEAIERPSKDAVPLAPKTYAMGLRPWDCAPGLAPGGLDQVAIAGAARLQKQNQRIGLATPAATSR